MNLQNQPGIQLSLLQCPIHPDHGFFDDVGGRSLNRAVHGYPFSELFQHPLAGGQFGNGAPSAGQGGDIALLFGSFHGFGKIPFNARIGAEIAFVGFRSGDAQIFGQREGGNAVDNTEVHRLGGLTHFRRYGLGRYAEDLGGSDCMNIYAVLKGVDHVLIARNARQQPQFDLGIVGVDQLFSRRSHKKPTQLPA